jgi:hypothetical protein
VTSALLPWFSGTGTFPGVVKPVRVVDVSALAREPMLATPAAAREVSTRRRRCEEMQSNFFNQLVIFISVSPVVEYEADKAIPVWGISPSGASRTHCPFSPLSPKPGKPATFLCAELLVFFGNWVKTAVSLQKDHHAVRGIGLL